LESSTNLFVFNDWDSFHAYSYFFTISDHLGNIRLVVDAQGQVQQKNEYGEERREMLRQAQQPGKRRKKMENMLWVIFASKKILIHLNIRI
jgi:hypothetical protein